jgi:heterodisulfide reductase subunit B
MTEAEFLGKILRRHPHAAFRRIVGEMVIVTPLDSCMHTLNDVGAFIWERADGQHTVQQIIEELCETYDVAPEVAKADVIEFVQELLARDMCLIYEPGEEIPLPY